MCALCGYPFQHAVSPGTFCAACTKLRPAFDAARAALVYDETRRKIILGVKYADRMRYANAFGAWMSRAGAELVPLVDVVVPVPLHPSRLIGRRYNQSLLLARAVAGLGRLPVIPDALRRNRNTSSQGSLSRGARHRNVQGAFSLRGPAEVEGKSADRQCPYHRRHGGSVRARSKEGWCDAEPRPHACPCDLAPISGYAITSMCWEWQNLPQVYI